MKDLRTSKENRTEISIHKKGNNPRREINQSTTILPNENRCFGNRSVNFHFPRCLYRIEIISFEMMPPSTRHLISNVLGANSFLDLRTDKSQRELSLVISRIFEQIIHENALIFVLPKRLCRQDPYPNNFFLKFKSNSTIFFIQLVKKMSEVFTRYGFTFFLWLSIEIIPLASQAHLALIILANACDFSFLDPV